MVDTSPPSGLQPALQDRAALEPPLSVIGERWAAIHRAGDAVALLAGLPRETLPVERHDFPAAICAAGGWRRALAEQGLGDLATVMEAGLTALLSLHRRGADPTVAARALWDEFHAARVALLDLAPPPASLAEHPLG